MKTGRVLLLLSAAALWPGSAAKADFDTSVFAFNSSGRTGSVGFARVAGKLEITVNYTSFTGSFTNASILSAVFFNINNPGALTGYSAFTGLGNGNPGAGGNINNVLFQPSGSPPYAFDGAGRLNMAGETAIKANVNGHNYGISSVGFSLFGPPDINWTISGPQYSTSSPPDGADYAILPSNFTNGAGNGGLDANIEVKSQVVYTLSGLGSGVDLGTALTGGTLWFGTTPGEVPPVPLQFIQSVPVPAGAVLFALGGACLYFVRRRRGHQGQLAAC
jgi:hypothetical protein